MAETITFRVGVNPRVETVTETAREGGSVDEVILSATEAATVRSLVNAIKADLLTAAGVSLIDKVRILEAAAPAQWDATNKESFDDLLDTVTAADFGADVKAGLSDLGTMLQSADASFTSTLQTAFKNLMALTEADGLAADDISIIGGILTALAASDASYGASHKDAMARLLVLILADTDISSVISAIAALE